MLDPLRGNAAARARARGSNLPRGGHPNPPKMGESPRVGNFFQCFCVTRGHLKKGGHFKKTEGGSLCRVANRVTGHLQHVNNHTRYRSVKITVVTFRIIRDREF